MVISFLSASLPQFLLVVSFTLLLSLLLPSMGHQQAAFPQEGPALVWILHRPQFLRGVPPSKSMSPAPYVLRSLSLPMSPQASPHVSSCVLPYQLSLSPKRAHAQHLLCLQGKHLADRQVKYDPKSLRASADLPLSSMSFGLCPNGMKTWQKNV